ncbi:MAG TPA: FAD-binding oxidoreductase, partial [Acidimicrobiales bacterium]|nr:FAD-binding oxidoreductase [Acidimicrobiales bacterium]
MHQVHDVVAAELARALAPDRVRTEPLELALYGRDASIIHGRASVVCFPMTTEEVRAVILIARAHGRAVVPRGSGTGLAGGAVPVGEGGPDPVVVVTTRMNRILETDADERVAWVEPGVLNLDLSRAVAPLGLHFAPDPSSQQACSIGGNVANNSGGPHCLAYGVTSAHVLAVEVVLGDGSVALLGGLEADPP